MRVSWRRWNLHLCRLRELDYPYLHTFRWLCCCVAIVCLCVNSESILTIRQNWRTQRLIVFGAVTDCPSLFLLVWPFFWLPSFFLFIFWIFLIFILFFSMLKCSIRVCAGCVAAVCAPSSVSSSVCTCARCSCVCMYVLSSCSISSSSDKTISVSMEKVLLIECASLCGMLICSYPDSAVASSVLSSAHVRSSASARAYTAHSHMQPMQHSEQNLSLS